MQAQSAQTILTVVWTRKNILISEFLQMDFQNLVRTVEVHFLIVGTCSTLCWLGRGHGAFTVELKMFGSEFKPGGTF